MPSQLLKNGDIDFLCAKNFVYRGQPYRRGDEFDASEANNIETLVRARFVIPVVDDPKSKPRHWHLDVQQRDLVEAKLSDNPPVQIKFENEPDDEELVGLETLTHPEPEEPNQADHMAEVSNNRILDEQENAEPEEEPEPEEPEEPFIPNPDQLQFPQPTEEEPPEPPDHIAESTVPTPEEQAAAQPEEPDEPTPDPEPDPEPAAEPEAEQVPEGTINVVKDWVGDDPDRAEAALAAEESGQNRSTLIAWLEDRLD